MASNPNQKLAVLIDADNAQAAVIQELLAEVSRYGTATIKRAYGDWTTTNLRGWKDVLHTMAIQPVQQFAYTSGKNATDSALIIDAMDVLHAGAVDGFSQLSKLMRKQDYLEIKEVPMGDGSTNVHLYVRCKAAKLG